jgi:hypothetical protein
VTKLIDNAAILVGGGIMLIGTPLGSGVLLCGATLVVLLRKIRLISTT